MGTASSTPLDSESMDATISKGYMDPRSPRDGRTPVQTSKLSFDPRSPRDDRTPLRNAHVDVDPRSPLDNRTPIHKNSSTLVDPRSPLDARTPIRPMDLSDPRSPSMLYRTPVSSKTQVESTDPRSPSLSRTPLNALSGKEEEVVHSSDAPIVMEMPESLSISAEESLAEDVPVIVVETPASPSVTLTSLKSTEKLGKSDLITSVRPTSNLRKRKAATAARVDPVKRAFKTYQDTTILSDKENQILSINSEVVRSPLKSIKNIDSQDKENIGQSSPKSNKQQTPKKSGVRTPLKEQDNEIRPRSLRI